MHQASITKIEAYNMIVRAYKTFCLRTFIDDKILSKKQKKVDKVIRKSIKDINNNLKKSISQSLSIADAALE